MVKQFVPQRLLRDPSQGHHALRELQGAVPDMAYTDPTGSDGKTKMVELKFIY